MELLAAYDTDCEEDNEAEQKLVEATEAYSSYQGIDEIPHKKKSIEKGN